MFSVPGGKRVAIARRVKSRLREVARGRRVEALDVRVVERQSVGRRYDVPLDLEIIQMFGRLYARSALARLVREQRRARVQAKRLAHRRLTFLKC